MMLPASDDEKIGNHPAYVEQNFVQKIHKVAEEHEWDHSEVNLPPQPGHVGFVKPKPRIVFIFVALKEVQGVISSAV
jgi:hypothetical protein